MARAQKPSPDGLLSTGEAMAELGIGRTSLRNLVISGDLERIDVNTSPDRARPVWRITRKSVERFKAERAES